MSFDPTEMQMKLQLQSQIQSSQYVNVPKNSADIENVESLSFGSPIQRIDSNSRLDLQGKSSSKWKIQIKEDMVEENFDILDSPGFAKDQKMKQYLEAEASKLDQQLIESLVMKVSSLEGQIGQLKSTLDQTNSSFKDLQEQKMQLENELSHQLSRQISQRQEELSFLDGYDNPRYIQSTRNYDEKISPQQYTLNQRNLAHEFDNESYFMQQIQESQHEDEDQYQRRVSASFFNESQHVQVNADANNNYNPNPMNINNMKYQGNETNQLILEKDLAQERVKNAVKMESIQEILNKKMKQTLNQFTYSQNLGSSQQEQQSLSSRNQPQKQKQSIQLITKNLVNFSQISNLIANNPSLIKPTLSLKISDLSL